MVGRGSLGLNKLRRGGKKRVKYTLKKTRLSLLKNSYCCTTAQFFRARKALNFRVDYLPENRYHTLTVKPPNSNKSVWLVPNKLYCLQPPDFCSIQWMEWKCERKKLVQTGKKWVKAGNGESTWRKVFTCWLHKFFGTFCFIVQNPAKNMVAE